MAAWHAVWPVPPLVAIPPLLVWTRLPPSDEHGHAFCAWQRPLACHAVAAPLTWTDPTSDLPV